jgi:hypothetical protein
MENKALSAALVPTAGTFPPFAATQGFAVPLLNGIILSDSL